MTKTRDTHFHKLVKKLISTERTKLLKSILEPLKPVEIANILLQLKIYLEGMPKDRETLLPHIMVNVWKYLTLMQKVDLSLETP